mmetsp:Transcript_55993/g.62602  ORF Transcript_55993/g.62602 Transcript_55993/m.62602 type:complete len:85 (-) Transcript_55993:303-557(-)
MFTKALSRLLLPNLERDLTKAVSKEMASASTMTSCFLAPSVYGYQKQTLVQHGVGHGTSSVEQRVQPTQYVKVHYQTPKQGLFQ